MKKIVLRADGSSAIGMGHVMRCIAISEMFKDISTLTFAIFSPDAAVKKLISMYRLQLLELETQTDTRFVNGFDAIVLDGYWFDSDYIHSIKTHSAKLIQVDDLAGAEFFADIIINHAIGADYSKSHLHNCKHLLVGSDYALLRSEFLNKKERREKFAGLDFVTISMGGSDPLNYTLKLLRSICAAQPELKRITVLTGTSYSHKEALLNWISNVPDRKIEIKTGLDASQIISLLKQTDLYICPASTVVYEAAAVGVPLACFLSADNQKNMYWGLMQTESVKGMGDLQIMTVEELRILLENAFLNYKEIAARVTKQKDLIDGCSGKRIKEALLSLWT